MREVYREGTPPKSLRFLYCSPFGKPVLRLLTGRFVSKVAGKYLDGKCSRRHIRPYVKKHGIDLTQFEKENYRSFNAFFTRKIKSELRPFDSQFSSFVSPCDGKVSAYRVSEGLTFHVKGFHYTVESLLKSKELAKKYQGGICVVLRLCVTDYHRYHYLDNGTKGENVFIKGRLHTVQPVALEKRRVFTENCREYTVMHTERFGDVVQVEVGALMVGRIVNHHGAGEMKFGEEKGKFEFGGSTIVLLLEKGRVSLDEEFFHNTEEGLETVVRCGERIGIKI